MEKVTFTPQSGEPKEILVPETFFYEDSPFSFPPDSDIGVVGDSIFTGTGDTTNPYNTYVKQRDNTWKKITLKRELQDFMDSTNAVLAQILDNIAALQPFDGTMTLSNMGRTDVPGTMALNFTKPTLPQPGANIYFVAGDIKPANPSSAILTGQVALTSMPYTLSPIIYDFQLNHSTPDQVLIVNLYNVNFTPVDHAPYVDKFYGVYNMDVSGINATSPTEHWRFEVLPNEGSYARDIVCGLVTFDAL